MKKQSLIIIILYSIFLVLLLGGNPLLQNWCNIFSCTYHSWEDLNKIIIDNKPDNYLIGTIAAFPGDGQYNRNIPAILRISVSYVSKTTEIVNNNMMYPSVTKMFTDAKILINPFIYLLGSNDREGATEQPEKDTEEIITRVIITPRDVFTITWEKAIVRMGDKFSENNVGAILLLGSDIENKYNCESVWKINYLDSRYDLVISYIINAKSGKIIVEEE